MNSKTIKNSKKNRPIIELFIIFMTYVGLFFVVLTELFWHWSAMASLGTFYLILGAPILMAIIAYRHRKTKTISKYHKATYILALAYFVVLVITLGMFLWII